MTSHELTQTWYTDDQGDKWPIYRWGDREIQDYTRWTWRGVELEAETRDNPVTGRTKYSIHDAVLSLNAEQPRPPARKSWDQIAWYAGQKPGLLLGLEVDARGLMYAKVWDGSLDLWGMDDGGWSVVWRMTTSPGSLLTNQASIPVPRDKVVIFRLGTQMLGPVDTVAELLPVPDADAGDDDFDTHFWGEALP